MSGNLAAFITARLDETAARAWAVHDVSKCDALLYEENMADAARRDPDCDCGRPARVLREVAALRAVMAETFEYEAKIDGEWGCAHNAEEMADGSCRLVDPDGIAALRRLATTWSDHPDYRQEWRP